MLELFRKTSRPFVFCGGSIHQVSVFQYVRHIFGSKDSPTCANYDLKRTATDNADMFPKAARSVHTNFYMDYYLESSPTAEEDAQKAKDLVKLLSIGGFNFTKFVSNDSKILNQIEPDSKNQNNDGKQLLIQDEFSHVLGLKWNHNSDTLVVSRGTTPDTTNCHSKSRAESCLCCVRPYWTRGIVYR